MEQIDLRQLVEQYPEVLTDGTKLKAYILDLYPQCKRGMVNILVAIQQCGIVSEMQVSKNPSALDMSRWKKVLDDDYGFAGATAETCLQLWCSAVGVQLEIKASAEQKANTVRSKVQNDNSQSEQSSVEVGDIYTFGAYQQDNNASNSKEAIEWIVLAKEGNKILLLSEKALDCKPYNTIDAKVTWNTCSLRKWINSTFLNTAFSIKEQKCIVSTLVSADKNPGNDIDPGNATTDKVFLLSITEVNKYLKYISSVEARKCVPTTYAVASGAYTSNSYTKGGVATCWWWLRSPGDYRNCAALINYDGSGRYLGTFVNSVRGCVRPALWIAIDSFVPDGRSSRAEIIQKDDPIIEVGDTYTFGTYEQGLTKDKEAIEWIVLEKAGNKILVVSKRGLDCKPYNTTNTNVTWETCSLRKWMNNTFLNAAFSAVEQEHIVSTSVSADENSKCSIKPGNVTMDKVFLLSITEVNKYLDSDYTRKCVPTYYAKANGVRTSIIDTKGGGGGGATCGWWLRSPGFNQNLAAGVGSDGSVSSYGSSVYINDCVRPALWINLDS